jgi:hypothetical protein
VDAGRGDTRHGGSRGAARPAIFNLGGMVSLLQLNRSQESEPGKSSKTGHRRLQWAPERCVANLTRHLTMHWWNTGSTGLRMTNTRYRFNSIMIPAFFVHLTVVISTFTISLQLPARSLAPC